MTEANMLLTAIRTVIKADVEITSHRGPDLMDTVFHAVTCRFVSTKQNPYIYETHTSWWEMFKDAYAPEWFKRRWPVKKDKHTVGVTLLYPHLKSELPRGVMGERVCLHLLGPANTNHFSMFDPDGPIDREDYHRMADLNLLMHDGQTRCRACGRVMHI